MNLRRGTTLAFLALAFGVILLGNASGQMLKARPARGGGFAAINRPGFPAANNQGNIRVNEEVRSYYNGSSTLAVKNLLNLAQYRGMALKKVILVAESRNGNARAELFINGASEAFPEKIGSSLSNTSLVPRHNELVLGRDIKTLQVRMQGQIYVEKVIAVLEESQRPGPGVPGGSQMVASKYLSQSFRGFETLPLRQLMNLDRDYRGMSIKQIVVRAESVYGNAQLRVKINGQQVGRTESLSRFRQDIAFVLPPSNDTLGAEIQRLELDLSGDIFVEQIEVHFERAARPTPFPSPMPLPSDRLTRVVNKPLQGAHALNLIDVMNATVFDGRREVSHIEITVSQANQRAALALCVNTARGQVCDTEEDLSFGRRTSVTLDVRGRTPLKDLVLMTKGTLRLNQITLYFQ